MATSVISNTITDPSGTALSGVRVVARLVPAPCFRADASEISPLEETETDGSGGWSLTLEETAGITPEDTYYEVVEYIPRASGGTRRHTIQVGASNQSLYAALVVPPPAVAGPTYLTQESGDLRYAQLGGGFGSPSSVGTANSAGSGTDIARANHVHDIGAAAIDAQGLFASTLRAVYLGGSPTGADGDVWSDTATDRLLVYNSTTAIRVAATASAGRTGVHITRTAAQSIPNNTDTDISWDAETLDTDSFFAATSTTAATVPAGLGGLYVYQFQVTYASDPGTHGAHIDIGGTKRYLPLGRDVNAAIYHWSGQLDLAAADAVKFGILHNNGGSINATASLRLFRWTV
jgi:hypothetical protein